MGHFVNVMFAPPPGTFASFAILYQALSEVFKAFVTVDDDDLWLMHHFLEPERNKDYSRSALRRSFGMFPAFPRSPSR
jgi:hypothetical protein